MAPVLERTVAAGASLERIVSMHDSCDPQSFNATVGPGTCLRNGGVQFDDFGGGIIPELNALLGNQEPPDACKTLEPDDFVPPDGTYTEKLDAAGTKKFQCCIRSWMHLTATVK